LEVDQPPLLEDVFALRILAWRSQVGIPANISQWKDELDGVSRHWAILRRSKPIAAARLSMHATIDDVPDAEVYAGMALDLPGPIASISRCVVHPDFRGRGLSDLLDAARLAAARQSGCRSVLALTYDVRRQAKLEGHGFRFVGTGQPPRGGPMKGVAGAVLVLHL
jgi:N-acetylglutamate synthase-like GNAT family acetyltransferase